jgi:hypothetical protein
MVPVFLCNRHNDIFAIQDGKQNCCVKSPQMIRGDNHISFRKFFQPLKFDICNNFHEKADNGAQCSVLHAGNFTTSAALQAKQSCDFLQGSWKQKCGASGKMRHIFVRLYSYLQK